MRNVTEENYRKIAFELEQDADGYPPDRWESLWAYEVCDGNFCINNIPFYVKGVSSGDVVAAVLQAKQLHFHRIVRASTNSVFRLYVSDVSHVQASRDLRELGCESELSNVPQLIAVELPGTSPIQPAATLLQSGVESGRWEYERGVLRHSITAG